MWSWTRMWASVRKLKGKESLKRWGNEDREPAVLPSVLGPGFFHTQPKSPSLSLIFFLVLFMSEILRDY